MKIHSDESRPCVNCTHTGKPGISLGQNWKICTDCVLEAVLLLGMKGEFPFKKMLERIPDATIHARKERVERELTRPYHSDEVYAELRAELLVVSALWTKRLEEQMRHD